MGVIELEEQLKILLKLPQFEGLDIFLFTQKNSDLFIFLEGEVLGVSQKIENLRKLASNLYEGEGLKVKALEHTTGLTKRATGLVCLRYVRNLSPVTIETLMQKFRAANIAFGTEKDLSHTLDKLRKSEYLVRSKSKKYHMTSNGLNLLGSKFGSDSPDIIRMLALARGNV